MLDSLYLTWENESLNNLDRVLAYDKFIWNNYIDAKPDSALLLSKKLIKFSEDNNFIKAKALALSTQGQIFYNQSNFPKSIDLLKESLEINRKLNDKKGIASVLNKIGNVHKSNNEYEIALEFYEESETLFRGINYNQGLADVLENIGSTNIYLGNYEKSLVFHKKSLRLERELGNKKGEATSLNNIGINYGVQGKYDLALEYFIKSYEIEKQLNNYKSQALSLYSIGMVHLRKNKNEKSIELCTEGLELIKNTKLVYEKESMCYCLYEAYKAKGDGNKALLFHEQMLQYNQSLKSEETVKKLQQMEFEKQVLADSLLQVEKDLKKEFEYNTEVKKQKDNRNYALAGGIFFLLLSGGLYGRWKYVKKSKAIIEKEKDRSDNLLLNILPSEIAEELKAKGSADARDFDLVSILFTDFKGFTEASEKMTAKELIAEINTCFKAFDHICESHGIEKIKTIGDAYMAAGGLPVPSKAAAKDTVLAALEMQQFICDRYDDKTAQGETAFKMRVGIHTGPVVAGIVGVKKFQYDIWGDTVNTASRMESSGEVDKINISEVTYKLLKDDSDFKFESRGKVKAKGKGEIEMFFVSKL
ncbi:adenylate/guanylate cyclase domain-containing protein [Winogradskyella sp. PE311]|uniref:adenylate/guanylate cyclase domain-containing protein n=1 Tax=Winogradskyella sp. PE311 TaxID=3366943 RepID=UPI0039800C46